MRWWMLTKLTTVIISQIYVSQTIISYTLNLYNDVYQLNFNKTGTGKAVAAVTM